MAGYTVMDFETTGFSPAHGDRVVEVAMVKVSHDGEIYDAWSTLVNPQRDVGASSIHGITARDVAHAPTFADIAPLVLDTVDGRILAAHNVSFDLRFLASELHRVGYQLPMPLDGVCTMRWADAFLEAPSRRLCDCCEAASIDLHGSHSALGDALATAQLLATYLEKQSYRPLWEASMEYSRAYHWPAHGTLAPVQLLGREATARRPDGWLEQIVARLPRAADPRTDSYLAVLEMAMLDGYLALHEQDQLVGVARDSGLTRPQVLAIHADYLAAMAQVALADSVVTSDERADLAQAAACLGLSPHDVDDALACASQTAAPVIDLSVAGITLSPGDRVVFTGEMSIERSQWEARARAVGLVPGGIAKATKVVVAGDPDSLSGKAAKARAYGIPIITEQAFEKLITRLQ